MCCYIAHQTVRQMYDSFVINLKVRSVQFRLYSIQKGIKIYQQFGRLCTYKHCHCLPMSKFKRQEASPGHFDTIGGIAALVICWCLLVCLFECILDDAQLALLYFILVLKLLAFLVSTLINLPCYNCTAGYPGFVAMPSTHMFSLPVLNWVSNRENCLTTV